MVHNTKYEMRVYNYKITKKVLLMSFQWDRYVPSVPTQILDHRGLLVLVEVVGDEANQSPNVKRI